MEICGSRVVDSRRDEYNPNLNVTENKEYIRVDNVTFKDFITN